jgi:hypothetical protein
MNFAMIGHKWSMKKIWWKLTLWLDLSSNQKYQQLCCHQGHCHANQDFVVLKSSGSLAFLQWVSYYSNPCKIMIQYSASELFKGSELQKNRTGCNKLLIYPPTCKLYQQIGFSDFHKRFQRRLTRFADCSNLKLQLVWVH